MEPSSPLSSRERVRLALNHQEPDRVPLDLGATVVTGIHHQAYQNLRDFLDLPFRPTTFDHLYMQLAKIDLDLVERLNIDVRSLHAYREGGEGEQITKSEDGAYLQYFDEFGVGWQMPIQGGMYYDMFHHPLSGSISPAEIDRFPLPDPLAPDRFQGVQESARSVLYKEGRALTVSNMCSGIFELFCYLRGYQDAYLDWAGDQGLTQRLLRRFMDLQFSYWEGMLNALNGLPIDVVEMSDDLAGQSRLLISPDSYRKYLKPLHRELFDFLHSRTDAKIFFHSCGSIRELIPDLIEIGVDILNPVQVNASGMDSAELKKEFGADLVFWGGGVDTQNAFDERFTPEQVRDDVRRRLDDLMPGGGFVFTPVHNIQGNVPPENIMAMWETVMEFGRY